MGKLFVCQGETVCDMSNHRALCFYELTKTAAEIIGVEVQIYYNFSDEYHFNKHAFLELVQKSCNHRLMRKGELLHNWLKYAIGVAENILKEELKYYDSEGSRIESIRYLRIEEI